MQEGIGARAAGQGFNLAALEEESGEVGLVCVFAAVKEGCFVGVVTMRRVSILSGSVGVNLVHCALVVLELDELRGELVMCLGDPGG